MCADRFYPANLSDDEKTPPFSTISIETLELHSVQLSGLSVQLKMANAEVIERLDPAKSLPIITYNVPFPETCVKHIKETLNCSRPFIIVSGSLSRNTDALQRLQSALGEGNVAGVRAGMQPHTLYSEVLEISKEIKKSGADSVITLGGGSLIDGAKAMVFVSVKLNLIGLMNGLRELIYIR